MNSVWLSLLWKEWCEFRWKLLALTASFVVGQTILMMVYVLELSFEDSAGVLVATTSFCLIAYGILAGAFVGMSVAAGENSNRTMRFTRALPIPLWQAGLARILVAFATVILPIIAAVAVAWLFIWYFWNNPTTFNDSAIAQLGNQHSPWGISDYFAGRAVASILGVVSLVLWVAACGVNRSDEVRAGAIAFLVCSVLWGMLTFVTEENVGGWRNPFETFSVALPGGPAFAANFGYHPRATSTVPLLTTIMIVAHGLILAFFLNRYGRSAAGSQVAGKQFLSDWFRVKFSLRPLRSQTLAIIWKQVREVAPLALLAVMGILFIVGIAFCSDRNRLNWRLTDWSSLVGGLTITVGALITLVSGIAVIYEDYSRGTPNFWRSRPINLHQWFILKYCTGIVILILSFGPLLLIANWLANWSADRRQVQIIALWLLLVYSTALAAYALIRQPIYAVVVTIALFFSLPLLLFLLRDLITGLGATEDQFMYCLAATLAVGSTVLAWQAVVRDWGWKQHR